MVFMALRVGGLFTDSVTPLALCRLRFLGFTEATQEHVTEAIRLFKVSTLSAAQSKTFEELGLGARTVRALISCRVCVHSTDCFRSTQETPLMELI